MINKKMLLSILIIGVVSVSAGAGTWAYFSDTETSSGNTFTAGTLDLTLGESNGAPINLDNMQPGDTASGTITVTNVGSLSGWLGATSSYVEADGDTDAPDGDGANMDADYTADMLIITEFTADGDDLLVLNQIPDVGSAEYPTTPDGRITVWDMVHDPSAVSPPHASGLWYSYDIDMIPDEIHVYVLTVQFDTTAGNDYQGDGIVWTFEFLLDQQ